MSVKQAIDAPFGQLVSVLLRRWRLIMTTVVAGSLLGGAVGLLVPARYTAKAQLLVEGEGDPGTRKLVDEETIGLHVAALTSRDFLKRIRKELADEGVPVQESRGLVMDLVSTIIAQAQDAVDRAMALIWEPAAQDDSEDDPSQEGMGEFERRLTVFQERRAPVVGVSYTSTSRSRAAIVVNRMLQLYIQAQIDRDRDRVAGDLAALEKQVPALRADMVRAEAEVQRFRVEHGLTSDDTHADTLDEQLTSLDRQLTIEKFNLLGLNGRLDAARKVRSGEPADTGDLVTKIEIPELTNLYHKVLFPVRPGTRGQLQLAGGEEERRNFFDEIDRITLQLEQESKIAGDRVIAIQARVAALQNASREVAEAEVRVRELQSESNVMRQLFENALKHREELNDQAQVAPGMRILSLASSPEQPSSPSPVMFIIPAVVFSFVGGGLLAVARDRMDRTFRTEKDLSETTGVPCVGFVPSVQDRKRRRQPAFRALSAGAFSEAVRRSCLGILKLAPAGPGHASKVLLVTSSLPGEGSTTLAASIAACAADQGRRVLIVDLALRNPGVANALEIPTETGRADVRAWDTDPASCIISVRTNLDCLPAFPRQGPVLISGDRIRNLLERLLPSYDLILVDGPPVHLAAETRLLADLADVILLAVKWASTRPEVVESSLAQLRTPGSTRPAGERIGTVLTQVDLRQHASYRLGDFGESFIRYERYFRA